MNINQTINSFSARTADRLTSARRATLTMLATFLIAMTAQTAWASAFSGGSGTSGDPYKISSTTDLNQLAADVNSGTTYEGKYFLLTANLTYTGGSQTVSNFTAIGGYTDEHHSSPYVYISFKGHFDGNGNTISGIRIYRSGDSGGWTDWCQGLFGVIDGGEVKNVKLDNTIITGYHYCGGIVGLNQGGTISNCIVTNSVSINSKNTTNVSCHGGIAGANDRGIISGCVSSAQLTVSESGASNFGGIAGDNNSSGNPGTLRDNLVIGATIPAVSGGYYGAITGLSGNESCNYYVNCKVGDTTNATNVGVGGASSPSDAAGARKALTISAATGVTITPTGTATTSNGLTTYADNNVIKYGDVFYSGAGESVSLTFSYTGALAEDKVAGYKVNDVAISGNSFTMPDVNATIAEVDVKIWGDGNDGSAEKPYVITTTAELDLLAQKVNAGTGYSGKFFKLGADITYDPDVLTIDNNGDSNADSNFTPIGNNQKQFRGTFDGNGKTISGININSGDAEYQGIFGYVSGTVKNLVVSNCSIVGRRMTGAIAGGIQLPGTIENCRVGNNVTLSGKIYVGGIVGSCERGTIKGCTSAATITGINNGGNAYNLGGVVGSMDASQSSTLTDNIFTGTINGDLKEYIGAIVGQYANGTLKNNLYTSTGFGGIGAKKANEGDPTPTGADVAGALQALTISAATGVTITPTGEATTYDVSGITVYADNKGLLYNNSTTKTLYAGATDAVKLSIAYTAPSNYEFDKIDAGEGVTVTASGDDYIVTMPASNVTVKVVYKAIEYKLTYNLAGGALAEGVSNPATYTVESDAITLKNPTREGYAFEGWTGTGLTEATTTVTIAKGSTGDRAYTATWKKLLTNTDIKVSAIANQTYTGSALTPAVTVKDGTTDITSQCDIAYSNNTNVGTATVTITAKATSAAYSGETTTTFGINAADGSLTVPTAKTGLVYSGSKQDLITAGSSTTGTIQYSLDGTNYGTTVPQGQDAKEYTVYYKVVAKDGYKDVEPASLKVTIAPKTVSSPTITLNATEYEYDGTAKEPSVTSVKDGDTVIPASEYTVSYENNKEAGTATVQIVDKEGGNYAVSGSTTFTIKAKADPDTDPDTDPSYEVDANGVATTTTIEDLAELALDDTMQDYVEDSKLKMTVTPKNKYWTLACGVDLLLPEGVKVYKARMNSAGTKVELTEIDATTLGGVLKANNGVLIEGTPGQSYDLVVSPNNSVTSLSTLDAKSYGTDNELEPVLEDTHFTTDDYFILTENKFMMVDTSKDTKVPAGKAVLKVPAGASASRSLDIDGDDVTGIHAGMMGDDNEVWYNLQGQRISKPSRKGVYILNGKKVRK